MGGLIGGRHRKIQGCRLYFIVLYPCPVLHSWRHYGSWEGQVMSVHRWKISALVFGAVVGTALLLPNAGPALAQQAQVKTKNPPTMVQRCRRQAREAAGRGGRAERQREAMFERCMRQGGKL